MGIYKNLLVKQLVKPLFIFHLYFLRFVIPGMWGGYLEDKELGVQAEGSEFSHLADM